MSRPRRWLGAARPALAVGAAAGLVALASLSSGAVELGSAPSGSAGPTPTSTPVRQSLAVCPGPETEGLPSVPGVDGMVTTVSAASAPQEAISASGGSLHQPATPSAPANGTSASPASPASAVRLLRRPGGGELGGISARGGSVAGPVTGATLVEVVGSAGLAPAVAALQTSVLRGESDDRGLSATACVAPTPDVWLLAGGGEATRRERLVVTNPGANTLTVDVEVFGSAGRRATAGASRVAVPPHSRVSLLLDALAPGEASPAVHVVATGGLITAVLEDSWIEGATARGRDDSSPAAPPALEQVVPATILAGPARLRLLVPGDDEAVVLARLLTGDGPLALPGGGVTRVKGGTVLDIDLGAVPAGDHAVHVRSDRPVIAAVVLERRGATADAPSELAWATATPALSGPGALTGSPVPAGATARLVLSGTAAPWSASVWTVAPDGRLATRTVTGDADSSAAIEVSGAGAVWVAPTSGTVYAGLGLAYADDPVGPLVSVVGLAPVPVLTTPVPVRLVSR